MKLPRYRTGRPDLDEAIAAFVERLDAGKDADLVFEIIASAARLALDRADRGDLKIANAALREMQRSFATFAPYRDQRKVAIFGSARTEPDDPLYDQTRKLAAAMAAREWMVITGAGPGIMEAGIEGAGSENSFGVGIRLPFEATTSELLSDDKLVSFRYFFTRKLEFVKEADAFVLLPGGFGTLDEAFELLTLVQTGKAQLGPIVLLDVPHGTYWQTWKEFVEAELLDRGYISPHDLGFVTITDDVDHAVEVITTFFSNYHSQRFVEGRLVLRVQQAPDDQALRALETEFADLLVRGRIERVPASAAEVADGDHPDLERIALHFDRRSYARLRLLIDRLNAPRASS